MNATTGPRLPPAKGRHVHYCPRDEEEWTCEGIYCAVVRRLWCQKHKDEKR